VEVAFHNILTGRINMTVDVSADYCSLFQLKVLINVHCILSVFQKSTTLYPKNKFTIHQVQKTNQATMSRLFTLNPQQKPIIKRKFNVVMLNNLKP